mmetsp:Transcript_17290/g.25927  ORF Transcript_17290/g.25927 Transcript_17290/m.25927 type:complete len:207 (-) Transcript_17290:678-1298(-)
MSINTSSLAWSKLTPSTPSFLIISPYFFHFGLAPRLEIHFSTFSSPHVLISFATPHDKVELGVGGGAVMLLDSSFFFCGLSGFSIFLSDSTFVSSIVLEIVLSCLKRLRCATVVFKLFVLNVEDIHSCFNRSSADGRRSGSITNNFLRKSLALFETCPHNCGWNSSLSFSGSFIIWLTYTQKGQLKASSISFSSISMNGGRPHNKI